MPIPTLKAAIVLSDFSRSSSAEKKERLNLLLVLIDLNISVIKSGQRPVRKAGQEYSLQRGSFFLT
jgi:hypothetical protein